MTRRKQSELKEALQRKRKSDDASGTDGYEAAVEPGKADGEEKPKPKKPRKVEVEQANVSSGPGKPKAKSKAKAKAKGKAQVKDGKGKSQASKAKSPEKEKKDAMPAKGRSKTKATFARRYEPNTKDGSKWWRSLRTAFEEVVKDEVEKPSSIEERCET